MGRVFFPSKQIRVAAKRHAEKVATQGIEYRGWHGRWFLILPWADMVRAHGLGRASEEGDGGHVTAQFGHSKLDLRG